jgi:hypothetical protein
LPRPGVFDGYPKTGVVLGTGDGVKTTFTVSNKAIKDLVVYVDGVISSDYTINTIQQIVFNTPIASGSTVTADYICIYIPKDSDHVLNVSMKIQFGGGQPTPVITPTPINAPGNQSVIAGSSTYGFFGEVVTTDLINGADLCSLIGLTAGTLQYSTEPWLKFVLDSRILYVAKKTIRYNVSWDNINATGAVWGDKIILLNGIKYAVRLLSSAEWNKLMYPIHVSYNTWASYSDSEIAVNYQVTPYGSATWTSTPSGSGRVSRGNNSLSYSNSYAPSSVYADFGFRPVLEIL